MRAQVWEGRYTGEKGLCPSQVQVQVGTEATPQRDIYRLSGKEHIEGVRKADTNSIRVNHLCSHHRAPCRAGHTADITGSSETEDQPCTQLACPQSPDLVASVSPNCPTALGQKALLLSQQFHPGQGHSPGVLALTNSKHSGFQVWRTQISKTTLLPIGQPPHQVLCHSKPPGDWGF